MSIHACLHDARRHAPNIEQHPHSLALLPLEPKGNMWLHARISPGAPGAQAMQEELMLLGRWNRRYFCNSVRMSVIRNMPAGPLGTNACVRDFALDLAWVFAAATP